jgi:glycosyltransferase involved in cell wall biosynthesis
LPVGESDPFRVVYFGQYIPLHGVNYIVEAAKLLEEHPEAREVLLPSSAIRFELVGDGQTYPEATSLAERLQVQNVTFRRTWLSPEDLIAEHIIPARSGSRWEGLTSANERGFRWG